MSNNTDKTPHTDKKEASENHHNDQKKKKFVFPWEQHNSHEAIVIPEEDKIHYPKLLLWYHITSKGFQIGSVAGMGAGIPLTLLDRMTTTQQPSLSSIQSATTTTTTVTKQLWRTMVTSSIQASLLGLVAFGSVATYFTQYHYDQNELDDVAFRVYHNHMMREWETIGWAGTIAGGLVGALRKSNPNSSYSRFYTIFRSGIVGTCVGMSVFGAIQAKRFLMD